MSEKSEDLKETKLHSIENLNSHSGIKEFYVASYQRGYRWGIEEVEYLLNDINGIAKDKKYCIQPLAVTLNENNKWELIDGQQRTTTVYLIQTALKNSFSLNGHSIYSIDYNTRKDTRDYLNDIRDNNILESYLDVDIDAQWDEFTTYEPQKDNVDNYHLFQAYLTIYNWLKKLSDDERKLFSEKLLHQTYVIWHPLTIDNNTKQTVEDFFINMNAGKIKLTSAELIKALFILDIDNSDEPWDIKDFKKQKLASEWDHIENELHDNTFWYFINNNNKHEYSTRIGKLFDIDCKKPENAEELFSYYVYSKKERLDWEKIKQVFQRLKEWYDDVDSFHLIGFIINADFKSLEEIIFKTEGLMKSEINDYFEQTIKKNFELEKTFDGAKVRVYELENLHYKKTYTECQNILLLYNIRLTEKNFPGQHFPFNLYQSPETKWSIEHIHPQNPGQITSKEHALEWLDDYEKRFNDEEDKESVQDNLDTIAEIKEELYREDGDILKSQVSDKIKDFSNSVNDALGLHQIGNLALLDKDTNSKIGNKGFMSKRKIIIEESDNNSTYIPLGTINNFLKKTTNAGKDKNIKVSYWSAQDSEDYAMDIEKLLKNYLPSKINE